MKHKLFNIGLQFFADGGKESEVAEPIADTDTDVEVDDDVEEYEEFDDAEADADTESEDDLQDVNESEPLKAAGKTEPDRNAIMASMRRQAEADARIKAQSEAKQTLQAEIDKAFADMGLRDPYTNKIISTKAEYDAYKSRHDSELVSKELGKAGISRETVDALIQSSPAMKEAQEAAKAYKQALQQTREQTAKVQLDEQIKAISAIDPDIKGLDDIFKLPNYQTIRGYVAKDIPLSEAYKLANMDKLIDKKTTAATQSAYNKTQSKEHLTSSAVRGQGEIPVPKKAMAQFRGLTGLSDKEAREYYAKYHKQISKGK